MEAAEAKKMLVESYGLIQNLIADRKLPEAWRACLEVLRIDPENVKVIRFRNKIEKMVRKVNKKAIKKDLKDLQPLWHEKKYDELLTGLKKLLPYQADYPRLEKIILKAQKTYNKELLAIQKKYFAGQYEQIRSLVNEKKYQQAVTVADKLLPLNFKLQKIKKILRKIRKSWVDLLLKQNEALLQSSKFEDMLLFCTQLKNIDPDSTKVNRLTRSIKNAYQQYRIEEKREFIYSSLEKIRTLLQLKKYEKALEALEEILAIDPYNREGRSLYKKAKQKTAALIEGEVITQMLHAGFQMKTQLKNGSKTFQRI